MISKLKILSKKHFKKSEKGQGITEYILLLVVVVAVVIMFKSQIQETIKGKIEELKGLIGQVNGGG